MNFIEAVEACENFQKDYSDKNKLPVVIKKSWNFSKAITYLPKSKMLLLSDIEYFDFGQAYSKVKGTEKKLSWTDLSPEELCDTDYVVGVNRDIFGKFNKEAWS